MLRRFRSRRSQNDEAEASQPQASRPSTRELSPATRLNIWHKKRPSLTTESSITELQSSGSTLLNPPSLGYRSRSPSPGPIPTTLGLHILHQPKHVAPVDIIFVHGLGGDSRATWSKGHDPAFFWPELWLPFDPDLGNARIFTFGYNANFRVGAPKSIATISDFAKQLLYGMAFGRDNNGQKFEIGKAPIIFIAHSMGGLVAKKAYLMGQIDVEYRHIVQAISAMIFLATPHRGSNLADILDRVLQVSFQSSKSFIKELKQSSPSIEEINETFRHVAPKLSIFSFYETLLTTIAKSKKVMVLDKHSSILGYENEVSTALDADHHDVCKYSNTDDPNYRHILDALKSLVWRYRAKNKKQLADNLKDIERLLAISINPEDDLELLQRRWMPGTGDWLFNEPNMQNWLQQIPETRVLWFSAPPASGKSILSARVINHLQNSGRICQYFLFKFSNQSQRSVNSLLRSIAYQVAKDIPDFKRRLLELSTDEDGFDKADSTTIWRRIFESILFEKSLDRPLYWVIDGLDESDSPKALVELLRSLPSSTVDIRLLIISRKTESLILAFDRLSKHIPVDLIEKDGNNHNSHDIRKYVESEITEHMRGNDALKQKVITNVMGRAGGNFLWVRLVVEEILNCNTEETIKETLSEIPTDMASLYKRMETTILNNPRKSDRLLAKTIFQWALFAQRSLALQELSQALSSDFPDILDLRRTLQDVCGQFILVNQNEQVELVHQTARDYLVTTSKSEISVYPRQAHEQLFLNTINKLLDPKLRLKLTQDQHSLQTTDPFIFYSATSWSYHLRQAHTSSDTILDILVKFFKGQHVLNWIHLVALVGRIEILVKAGKVLSTFLHTYRKLNATKNPLLHRLSDLDLLDLWAIDLVKIVGKFSRHLLFYPQAIYELVPALCPERSILRRQFYQPGTTEISLSGISDSDWSDNLAKISLPNDIQAWKIICAAQYIAVQGSTGTIFIWNSSNFVEVCTLAHDEPVTAITFSKDSSKIATYGLRSTKLWSIPSGQLLASTPNPKHVRAMAMAFSEKDTKLLTGSDDRTIRYIYVDDFSKGWQVLNAALLKETVAIEGTIVNSPMYMAFNGDATQVGVSYRAFPLSVWDLNEGRCIGRCRRAKEARSDTRSSIGRWFPVDRFTWNPVSGHIIGIYKDGTLFKWHPMTDENHEVRSSADEVAASPDGKLFVTSDSNGTVKVWNFAYFSVIYQLSSSDLVMGLAFSPDCRRFYDIRGSYINAWESNSLIRFSENEETYSDTASEDQAPTSISHVSEAHLAQYDAITALAIPRSGSLYCVGNEEGVVNLADASTGKSIELMKFRSLLDTNLLTWSNDGRYIAAADISGDIFIKHLTQPGLNTINLDSDIQTLTSPKVDLEDSSEQQLLFNHDSSLLLIMSEDQGVIWGINTSTIAASAKFTDKTPRKWLRHPTQGHLFLGFGVDDVKIFQWKDFMEQNTWRFADSLEPSSESKVDENSRNTADLANSAPGNQKDQSNSVVNKVIFTQDERHILVQIKHTSIRGKITKSLLIFGVSAFEIVDNKKLITPLTYLSLTPDVASTVEVPLDILAGSRLVFLDKDLWICTLRLGSKTHDEVLKRHYFIPRDWVNSDSLEQCCMLRDGTFLCPKEDKIAVIKKNLETGSLR
ncbi:hypothetical protein F5884DRAFT_57550 [Xylogone sp. PMI_703]|nr:hypothetical protein F5884DRAFT_57550 [Xylogone sp. PMI_703]